MIHYCPILSVKDTMKGHQVMGDEMTRLLTKGPLTVKRSGRNLILFAKQDHWKGYDTL